MSRDSTNQVLFEASDTNVIAEVPCTFWLQVVFPTLGLSGRYWGGIRAPLVGVACVLAWACAAWTVLGRSARPRELERSDSSKAGFRLLKLGPGFASRCPLFIKQACFLKECSTSLVIRARATRTPGGLRCPGMPGCYFTSTSVPNSKQAT